MTDRPTKYIHVRKHEHRTTFQASITIGHLKYHLGSYDSLEEAQDARDAWLMKRDGSLFRLNKTKSNGKYITQQSIDEIHRLIDEGYGDTTISLQAGVTVAAVEYHRRKKAKEERFKGKDGLLLDCLYSNRFFTA